MGSTTGAPVPVSAFGTRAYYRTVQGRARTLSRGGGAGFAQGALLPVALAFVFVALTAPCASAAHPSRSAQERQAYDKGLERGGIEPHSKNPSGSKPYAVCPAPSAGLLTCLAAAVPEGLAAKHKASPSAPRLQGSGELGGYSPADLRSAYNLPSEGGGGLTIAITVAYDYPNAEADLATYRETYGLPPCTSENGCFEKVNQEGEAGNYPEPGNGWAAEAALDLDMTSAICPECKLLLVEANNSSSENLPLAVDTAASLGADVISDSWGGPEFAEETSFDAHFDHPGTPVLFASGDSGYGAEFPASSPDVIAVGGTSLRKDSSPRGWSESAWIGAGSGCSAYEEKPPWQSDSGCPRRSVADVAAVADPETPVSVYDTYGTYEGWQLFGGTSVATPIIAGVEALSGLLARAEGAQLFWESGHEGKLFDVGEGRNGSCPPEYGYLCNARLGYDGPTGWGTPGASRPAAPAAATYEPSAVGAHGATLEGAVDANGRATTYHFEFDTSRYEGTASHGTSVPIPDAEVGAGVRPVAVEVQLTGLSRGVTYHYRLVASNDLGTTYGGDHTFTTSDWSPQYLPRKEQREEMFGVSCPAADDCIAVGLQDVFFEPPSPWVTDAPLIEHWNGSEWTRETAPRPHPNAAGYGSRLEAVSCSSPGFCMAVGTNYEIDIGYQPLAEMWNGSEWSILPAPMPTDAGPNDVNGQRNVRVHGVSCVSASYCVMVGEYTQTWNKGEPTSTSALVETWDGSEWVVDPVSNPSTHIRHILWGVSCTSSTFCFAVGGNDEPWGGEETGLIEHWDGAEWTLDESASIVGGLQDVSCVSKEECMAVGGSQGPAGGTGLAEFWNGSDWSGSAIGKSMRGVSCPAAGVCVAAGGDQGSRTASAARWEGGEWAEEPPTRPTDASDVPMEMYDVSCFEGSCTDVGWYWSWGYQPLAERLTVSPTPSPPSVRSDPAETVTRTSARLNGKVNDNSSPGGSSCHFVVALASDPGSPIGQPVCGPAPVEGALNTAVHAEIEGLQANTEYVYGVVAENGVGPSESAHEASFATLPEPPIAETDMVGSVTQTTAVLRGHVDNRGAPSGSTCRFVVALESAPEGPVAVTPCGRVGGEGSTPVEATASSLAAKTRYVYRVLAANSGGSSTVGPEKAFETMANPPAVDEEPATAITQTTAVLHGHVDNEGAEGGSSCKFRVFQRNGPPGSLPPETVAAEPACAPNPVTGSGRTAVQASLTGLSANVEYSYRVVAESEGGTTVGTSSQEFKTLPNPPAVANAPATAITPTTAVLHGEVDNKAAAGGSSCRFEVALKASPGAPVDEPTCDPSPVSGNADVSVGAETSGLRPNTEYVYRIVAENSGGVSKASALGEFATLRAPPNAAFSVPTPSPIATRAVIFDGSASSSLEGPITSYTWDFGDGSGGSGIAPSHVYDRPGHYTVTLTVSAPGGLTGSASQIVQVADAAPLASFSVGTRSPTAAQSVAFDGSSSSDPDGSIVGYAWDFGDGSHANGSNPSHVFTQPGNYRVVLTVTDNAGLSATAQRVVAVGRAPNAFAVQRTTTRCNGTIALILRAPAAGTFRARAKINGLRRARASHDHHGRHRHRGAYPARASIRVALRRPIRSGHRRRSSIHRDRPHRGSLYGSGRARSRTAGVVRLTLNPRRVVRRAMRQHPHSQWRLRVSISFGPLGGTPRTRHVMVVMRSATGCDSAKDAKR